MQCLLKWPSSVLNNLFNTRTQWCAGGGGKGPDAYVVLATFRGVNTPTPADLRVPVRT